MRNHETPSADPLEAARRQARGALGLPFIEFIAIIALMMALTAFSVDVMLTALPEIGDAFSVTDVNHRQLVVGVYMIGFALGQIIYGPLSDRYGRKPVLYVSLLVYLAGTVFSMMAPSFEYLLAGRLVQGIGCGGPRQLSRNVGDAQMVGPVQHRLYDRPARPLAPDALDRPSEEQPPAR